MTCPPGSLINFMDVEEQKLKEIWVMLPKTGAASLDEIAERLQNEDFAQSKWLVLYSFK